MKVTRRRRSVVDPALAWSDKLSVEVGGAGTVAQAGVVLPRLLADRLGLCTELAGVVARAGFFPLRHRGRALVDAACSLAAGATCLSDIEAMTAQEEIFGPGGGASDSTMLRVLDELAGRLRADGLPGRRLARATAGVRAKAWAGIVARHGQLPAVKVAGKDLTRPATASGERPRPVLVVGLDATLVEAASPKAHAAGTYKQGFGFHPLTAWCTNIGDGLAVMLRPGNAGSFTACDHIAVLTAAFAQIPAAWRTDVLVSIDGAGASHEIINYLTGLNTAAVHGNRGRRVEYTIGWPIDEPTLAGISELRQYDWGDAVDTDGVCDPAAQVADLTGILHAARAGTGWPPGPPTCGSSPAVSPDPPLSKPNSARTPSGSTARSPPTPPPGSSSGSMPATAPRPTSRTGSSSSRPAAPATCPPSTTTATPPGCNSPRWPRR